MAAQTIVVRIIPHEDQRYETLGDWVFRDEDLLICVSDTGDERSNIAISIHELVEAFLCKYAGITQQQVDRFDTHEGKDSSDPGDMIDAPYTDQHSFATAVERMFMAAIGMPWAEHERNCAELQQ